MKRYLLLGNNNTKTIHFLKEAGNNCGNDYRISPIFSVINDPFEPEFSTHTFISYLYCEHAFTVIGKLLNEFPSENHNKIWFSHGLASIIVIANDLSIIQRLKGTITSDLRAFETWEISSNQVAVIEKWVTEGTDIDVTKYTVRDFSSLPSDICNILHEFTHCINAAVIRSAQYIPKQLYVFECLVKAVDRIVEQLLFLESGKSNEIPEFLPGAEVKEILDDEVKRKKHFHFISSQLVQINSAVSYLISQGFSGTIPLLENECHVRYYSFLGIGTAYSSLSCFSRHVERIFQDFPVAGILTSKIYQQHPAPKVFTLPRGYTPDVWDETHRIDKFFELKPEEPDNPKLVYYSGRQGFRETKFCVSAPINILFAAGTARWSLMTLSHELMHAHVSAIIAAILTSEDCSQDELFGQMIDDYQLYRKDKLTRTITLIEFLRFSLLSYCYFAGFNNDVIQNIKKKGEPQGNITTFTKHNIRNVIEKHYSDINEIMVHVLDYTYFYDSNDEVYLGLLWESWTPVPIVLEKIERYLLRSLLAIGTKEAGTPINRFNASVKTLQQVLKTLSQSGTDNIVINQALKYLESNSGTSPLFYRFSAGIYLADVTAKFLTSSKIHARLMNDDMRDIGEEQQYVYRLNVGTFEEVHVKSPVALCDDLLRRSLSSKEEFESESASAWAFLACASYDS